MMEFDHTFWSDRPWDLRKQVIDQVGHMAYAVVVLAPVLLMESLAVGCTTSAFLCGFIREWEQWSKRYRLHFFDRAVDIAFFAVGGFLAYLFFGVNS